MAYIDGKEVMFSANVTQILTKLYRHYITVQISTWAAVPFVYYSTDNTPITDMTKELLKIMVATANFPCYTDSNGGKFPISKITTTGRGLAVYYFTDVTAGATDDMQYSMAHLTISTDEVTEA